MHMSDFVTPGVQVNATKLAKLDLQHYRWVVRIEGFGTAKAQINKKV